MCIVKFCLQHYILVKFSNNILTIITYQFGSYDTIRRGDIFLKLPLLFFDIFCAKIFQVQKMGTTGTASTSAPPQPSFINIPKPCNNIHCECLSPRWGYSSGRTHPHRGSVLRTPPLSKPLPVLTDFYQATIIPPELARLCDHEVAAL